MSRRLLVLLAILPCVPSCLDATQITVDIRTLYVCGDTDTGIFAGGPDVMNAGDAFTATKPTCTKQPDQVGTLVVVPSQTNDEVYLRVVAGVDNTKAATCAQKVRPPGANCIEARRILRFVPHQSLRMPIMLDRSCINVVCPERQTCEKGMCVNAMVTPSCIDDPSTCPDASAPDSGVVIEAGPVGSPVRLLAAGFDSACAVRESDDAIFCWGTNKNRLLGPNGSPVNTSAGGLTRIPAPKGIMGKLTRIAIGDGHVCVTDGLTVSCWGGGASGQLGRSGGGAMPDPNADLVGFAFSSVTSLTSGAEFTCAVDVVAMKPTTRCWGAVVPQTLSYTIGSSLVPGDPGFLEIAAGAHHVCGYPQKAVQCNCPGNCHTGGMTCTLTNATMWCWGDNYMGQSNVGVATTFFPKPYGLTSLPTNVIGAGFDHTARYGGQGGDLWGGSILCDITGKAPSQISFTKSDAYMLTSGAVQTATSSCSTWTHIALPADATAAEIAAGTAFACARTVGKKVYCWGTLPPVITSATPTEIMLP